MVEQLSIRKYIDGKYYVWVKIDETWRRRDKVLIEEATGNPFPAYHSIVYLDGNTTNCIISNLKVVRRNVANPRKALDGRYQCKDCHQWFDKSEFYSKSKKYVHVSTRCRKCDKVFYLKYYRDKCLEKDLERLNQLTGGYWRIENGKYKSQKGVAYRTNGKRSKLIADLKGVKYQCIQYYKKAKWVKI